MNLMFKENSLCVRVYGLFVDEFIFSGVNFYEWCLIRVILLIYYSLLMIWGICIKYIICWSVKECFFFFV